VRIYFQLSISHAGLAGMAAAVSVAISGAGAVFSNTGYYHICQLCCIPALHWFVVYLYHCYLSLQTRLL